ncbi:MAG TPA: hypothetical protein VM243_11265 [Phycisphaerae bacterium]|nr:hypothetical protein [Phycisphaerae bacterium]
MAIQFPCPACQQPIEVDDEWASRSVACPFCRTTVTAPATSTLAPPSGAPTASPVGADVFPPTGPAELPPEGNPLAVWAIVLALAAPVFYFVSSTLFYLWQRELIGPDANPEEIQQTIMEQAQAGNMPAGVMGGCLLLLVAFGLWVAGLACGIAALRRASRRRLAIAALVLSGVLPLIACLGMVLYAGGGLGG